MQNSRDSGIRQSERKTYWENGGRRKAGWEHCWDDWCGGFWRSDRLDAVGWAAGFIWAALVILTEATNLKASFSWWDGWAVFFTGAGVIVLMEAALRLLIPEYRHSWVSNLLFGTILLGIGLGDLIDWSWVLAFGLVVIGVVILQSAFTRRS